MTATYPMIGLMSGTSGDGLDIVYATFEFSKGWTFELVCGETIPFPGDLGNDLSHCHLFNGKDLALLDIRFGHWMGKQVADFCNQNGVKPLAVASHGHTVFHQPEKLLTLQIGNGWALHTSSHLPVVNDFRSLDVQLGGQGAPLVPIGDKLLFSSYDYCLNLGGIANISMERGNQRIAYDVCPFNLLFNFFAKKAGKPYDDSGRLARSGTVIPHLLDDLSQATFYTLKGAKSLGREDIEKSFLPLVDLPDLNHCDILATLSEHFATIIASSINETSPKKALLLATGGGAFNTFFLEKLASKLDGGITLSIPEETIIAYKEALVFAFLGVLRLRHEINSLASVSGASRDNCGGTLYGFEI
ncbi:MAG TPA: anhydro-N-acetylmuramic acid kinase [Lunatimonas sp.]|nr:anhydro-N-acetylmuramic acid kinase [Lunatimonas sp.]